MVAPTSVVQYLVILHNFFDALCLMWQNLQSTVAESLTIGSRDWSLVEYRGINFSVPEIIFPVVLTDFP